MRKHLSMIFTGFLLIALTACGTELSVEEVLERATAASEELDSYTADMNISTEFMGLDVSVNAIGDVTLDPDTMYMEMSIGAAGITMDVDVYMADEEVYMSIFDQWIVMDEDEFDSDSFNVDEQLDGLDEFVEQFEMTVEDDVYVLTLNDSGDEFEEYIRPFLEASLAETGANHPDFDEDISFSVNNVDMRIQVDKETMVVQSQVLEADLEIDEEPVQIQVEMDISNINEVEPIEIPDDVKDNAVPEDFLG